MVTIRPASTTLLTLILLLVTASRPARGEESAAATSTAAGPLLGLSLGVDSLHVRDEYLTPFTQRGRLASAAAVFEVKRGRTTHTFELGMGKGRLGSDEGRPADVTANTGSASYSLVRSVANTHVAGRPLDFSAGGGLSTSVSYNTLGIPANTDWYGADESWYWSHALQLQLRADYRFTAGGGLSIRLTAPVARIVSRPDNGHHFSQRNVAIQRGSWLNAAKGGEGELLWDNLATRCDVEYRQRLGTRLALRANYAFGVFSSRVPLSMRTYTSTLLLGVLWRP